MKISTTLSAIAAVVAMCFSGQIKAQDNVATLPYEITFDSADAAATWATINANNDGYKWEYSSRGFTCGVYSSVVEHADDYAISPAFALEEGVQYEVTYDVYRYASATNPMSGAFKLVGSRSEVDPAAVELEAFSTTKTSSDPKTFRFTATVTGVAYIALHVTSVSNSGQLIFRSFSIAKIGNVAVPGAVTNAVVKPYAKGEKKASIAFNAPAVDSQGAPLKGTVNVSVYREDDESPLMAFTDKQPGEQLTVGDWKPYVGETYYRFVPSNSAGEGEEVQVEVYIGVDVPTEVLNLSAAAEDDAVKVQWSAPAASQHNGYIDWTALTYTVSRVCNGVLTQLSSDVAGTEYVDTTLPADEQQNVSYQVVGVTSAGFGRTAQSNVVNVGPALSLPFAESVSGCVFATSPWRQQVVQSREGASQQPAWDTVENAQTSYIMEDEDETEVVLTITSQDTDGGMLRFNANFCGNFTTPGIGRLILPSLDFAEAVSPVLGFYLFRETYYTMDPADYNGRNDDLVKVEVSADGADFVAIDDAVFHRYGTNDAWVKCEVPLKEFAGKSRVAISLTGVGLGGGPIFVDNLTVVDTTESAVEDVKVNATSEGNAEYYNLQGIRVDNPQSGIYIRRIGSKATKVLVR